jgi:polysaccharide biosynthesis/export protein
VTEAYRTDGQPIRPVLFPDRSDERRLFVVCPNPSRRQALRRLATLVICGIALWGCGGPEVDLTSDTTGGVYRLDSGDHLRIVVYGDQQLSGDYVVDDEGAISMPLINRVDARGLTPEDLEQTIAKRLADGFLVDPSVNVQIQGMRPFFILGEVKQPGQYSYANSMTVLSAVAVAGGFTYRAKTDYVQITRRDGNKVVKGRADLGSVVQPGDVVYVYERYF